MLHILVILAAAIPVGYALRWIGREHSRVENSLRKVDRSVRRPASAVAPLVFDATVGFYRPAD
jgi:hypothetical protein